ncbi:MAG: TerB family tellurite resistance protein [Thauera phenolivorans]|uniref:TerB family tellurite resistance protein n=1 Tax=Thauera phenolivorans TaxID=1792543 RepID=A0A7X7R8Z0_9RHOO|nr:TerB family tellurite resistance protein [Thauera phenolivorans]NLF55705.1 TerB family tellurite resistance protein [Thauera phenolivorans]
MLKTLKQLFDTLAAPSPASDAAVGEHTLQLATAVLLVEVMRADHECSRAERETAIAGLRVKFGLGEDEVERLFELAETTSQDAPDLYGFTSKLNRGFSIEQKLHMIEYLWQVAFADGQLSHLENHLMLKLGDLLYIPRGDFVAAKQRARAAAGMAPE